MTLLRLSSLGFATPRARADIRPTVIAAPAEARGREGRA
jgi:hypothetical protein